MPWQLQLKRKDGTIRAHLDSARGSDKAPIIGDMIDCPIDDEMIRAKVTAIQATNVGAEIGQPLDIVHAEEI